MMITKAKKTKHKGPTMLGMTILEVVHEMAKGLHKAGGIDAKTMREYEALCLPEVKELSANGAQF